MSKGQLNELLNKQLKNVSQDKRLRYKDMSRISAHIDTSIFGDECALWTGYVTNEKNARKGMYINFFFNGKKMALHRLIYANFVGDIDDTEYLKFSCENRGKCCNVHHLVKYAKNIYESDESISTKKETIVDDTTDITITFD